MQKFNCKHCGAELYWDSDAQCLKCEYCGSSYQVSDFEIPDPHEEKKEEPKRADASDRATDNSDETYTELVVYRCSHCGAEIITAKSTIATTCAYCGRALALTDKMVGEFRPEVAIPFEIDEQRAKEIYKKYIRSSILTPKFFTEEAVVKKMKGVYVPFWLHSFQNDMDVLLQCETVSSRRRGDDLVHTHRMYDVNFKATGTFSDIPTDALKNLDNALMDALEPYDYSKLETFHPAYMAGYYAEEYNESADETQQRAMERAHRAMLEQSAGQGKGYVINQTVCLNETYSGNHHTYAMLPVWLLNVVCKQKEYLFAINGETGKITGKLPISVPKLLGIAAGSLGGSTLLLFAIRLFMALGGLV